jgi:hypothetical protein
MTDMLGRTLSAKLFIDSWLVSFMADGVCGLVLGYWYK